MSKPQYRIPDFLGSASSYDFALEYKAVEDRSATPDDGILLRLSGPAIPINRPSGNRKLYNAKSVADCIAALQPRIAAKALHGETDHPPTDDIQRLATVKLSNASHRIDAIWFNEAEQTWYIDVSIWDNEHGRKLHTIHKGGSPLYVSLRSLLDPVLTKTRRDGIIDAYMIALITIDFVSEPGFADMQLTAKTASYESQMFVCESLGLHSLLTRITKPVKHKDMKHNKYKVVEPKPSVEQYELVPDVLTPENLEVGASYSVQVPFAVTGVNSGDLYDLTLNDLVVIDNIDDDIVTLSVNSLQYTTPVGAFVTNMSAEIPDKSTATDTENITGVSADDTENRSDTANMAGIETYEVVTGDASIEMYELVDGSPSVEMYELVDGEASVEMYELVDGSPSVEMYELVDGSPSVEMYELVDGTPATECDAKMGDTLSFRGAGDGKVIAIGKAKDLLSKYKAKLIPSDKSKKLADNAEAYAIEYPDKKISIMLGSEIDAKIADKSLQLIPVSSNEMYEIVTPEAAVEGVDALYQMYANINALGDTKFSGNYGIEHMPKAYTHIWSGLSDAAKEVIARKGATVSTEQQALSFWSNIDFVAVERAIIAADQRALASVEHSEYVQKKLANASQGLANFLRF